MSSKLQEKISQMIGSYNKMSHKDTNKLVQDLIALLFQEKMDRVNLGNSLSMIQKELNDHSQSDSSTESIMENLKTNMSQVLTNAIMNRIKQ